MIREAALADVPALTQVESACFVEDAWNAALVESEVSADTRSVLLASDESTVTGYGSIMVVDDVADLQRIAVIPGARRGGLGRELLGELLAKASRLGATRIMLEVAAENAPAIGLYDSFGFSEISRRRNYYANGVDALVMELALS
ncbi:MAG: ribosomal protein S18-alanine N-acetyltransferase [Aeromicrobium sp.]